MPVPKDPATVAKKWANNLSASTQQITNSVNAMTVNPCALAAAAVNQWQAAVNTPEAARKFQQGLNKVPLNVWQQAMTGKGVQRIPSGAQAAIGKMTTFMTAWLQFVQGCQNQIANMPKDNFANRTARMNTMIQCLHGFPGY